MCNNNAHLFRSPQRGLIEPSENNAASYCVVCSMAQPSTKACLEPEGLPDRFSGSNSYPLVSNYGRVGYSRSFFATG